MKTTCITITLVFWMIFTLVLALSIIGAICVIAPKVNNTRYDQSQEQLRSTWMRIGYDLKEKLINI